MKAHEIPPMRTSGIIIVKPLRIMVKKMLFSILNVICLIFSLEGITILQSNLFRNQSIKLLLI